MKKFLALLLSFVVAFTMAPLGFVYESYAEETSAEDTLYYGEPGEDYEEGEIIVCVQGGTKALVASGIFSKDATKLASSNKQIKADKFDGLEATIAKQEITIDETLVEFEATEGEVDQAAAVSKNDEEAYAEAVQTQEEESVADEEPYSFVLVKSSKDDITKLIEKLEKLDCVAFAEPNIKCEPTAEPLTLTDASDEPGYKYQWYSDKDGVGAEFDMAATEAYGKADFANQKEVVVAVMDSGVDYTHPDLEDSMWSDGLNYPSLQVFGGGKYGINTADILEDRADPMDTTVGHGTHCASTIASNWKNEAGTAGINGNAKIMACRWMSNGGIISDWIIAMEYVIAAKIVGVPVVATNNSWGPTSNLGYVGGSVDLMCNLAGEQGIVNCFAAGNDSWNHDNFPNLSYSSPYIVTVGAMQSNGEAASFSERGAKTVDVFAPGAQILAATTTYNNGNVDMAPQYLPWIQTSSDSVIYEDYEDNNDVVSAECIRIPEGSGNPSIIRRSKGLGDSVSLELDLSSCDAGDKVGFVLHVPKSAIDQITDKCFMAFGTGAKNMEFVNMPGIFAGNKNVAIVEYWNGAEWKTLTHTVNSNGKTKTQPTLVVGYSDSNYSVMSGKLTASNNADIKSATSTVGELKLRLAIEITKKDSNAEFYIDNFGIGTKASDYYYSDGTSMATPCTAAVVSMIAGARSEIPKTKTDAQEVIVRLKGGVKKTGKLENDCVTQGCVQAASAFMTEDELNPVPTGLATYTNGTAKIGGYFFGDSSGNVKIAGVSANVLSWSDKEIKIEIPGNTKYGVQEIAVTKSNGNTGRWFSTIKLNHTESDKGYIDLKVPDFGIPASSKIYLTKEMLPVRIAANDDGILAILIDEESPIGRMVFYSFSNNKWADAQIEPSDNFKMEYKTGGDTGNVDQRYALAGSGHKFYLACNNAYSNTDYRLCTLDTSDISSLNWGENLVSIESFWKKTVSISPFKRYAPLGIIDGKLYIALGNSDGTIYELDPNKELNEGNMTPSSYTSIGNIEGYTSVITGAGGYFLTSGNTKVIAGYKMALGNDAFNKSFNPIYYRNGAWVKSQKDFYASADANQLYWAAYGATNQGFIMAGPAKDIGKETMNDTWAYDISSDSYRALGVSVDNSRMRAQTGTCHGNKFYVLGSSGNDNKLIFKYLDLSEFDLSQYDHTHTTVHHASNDATREASGNTEYWSCETCDKYFSDGEGLNECSADSWIIPRVQVHMTHYEAITATCTADGRSEYWRCSEDGKYYSDNKGLHEISADSWIIPALGHESVHHASSNPTCTAEGWHEYWTCSRCNTRFGDSGCTDEMGWISIGIPALGHNATHHEAIAATCTADGYQEYWYCDRCDKYFSDSTCATDVTLASRKLDKLAHTLTEHTANVATCTADGNEKYWTCSSCGKYFDNAAGTNEISADSWIIPAHHTLTAHASNQATCMASGNSAYWSCNSCGKYFSNATGQNEISANSWEANHSPLGHEIVHVSEQAATSTAYGWHEHWKCTRTGCDVRFRSTTGDACIAYTDESWKIPATGGGTGGGGSGSGGGGGTVTTDPEPEEKPVIPINPEKLEISNVTFAPTKEGLEFSIKGLEEDVDYEVHYIGLSPTKVGKHKADVIFKGQYQDIGIVTVDYIVVPQGTSVKKLSPKKKSMTVSLEKQRVQTTGYQIRYGLKSNMKSAKTVTITKNTKSSATIKNLKSKKKYYVQTRTYKNVKETVKVKGKKKKKTVKYCSSWSEKKSVKVK